MLHTFLRSFWLSLSLTIVGALLFVVATDYAKFSSSILAFFDSEQTLFLAAQDMIAFVLAGTVIFFVLSLFSDYQSMAARKRQDRLVALSGHID
jgi:uncharacterized membrane protein